MASEVLAIPEEHLREFIRIIRSGLENVAKVSRDLRSHLEQWCEEEESYIDS